MCSLLPITQTLAWSVNHYSQHEEKVQRSSSQRWRWENWGTGRLCGLHVIPRSGSAGMLVCCPLVLCSLCQWQQAHREHHIKIHFRHIISVNLHSGLRNGYYHPINRLRALLDLKLSKRKGPHHICQWTCLKLPRLKVAELRPQPDHCSVPHILTESLCCGWKALPVCVVGSGKGQGCFN